MLCEFADTFPPFVAEFLQRGRQLKRKFREETITDMLMAALVPFRSEGVIVDYPDERSTGADMEWNFVQADRKAFFRILLQAKQIYGEGNVCSRHSYSGLYYRPDTSGKLQAEILADTARASITSTLPLYIFYHPRRTCELAAFEGMKKLNGINLADGYLIERLVTKLAGTRHKSLKTIYPILFSLSDIFCPPTILAMRPMMLAPVGRTLRFSFGFDPMRRVSGRVIPPTPAEVRARIIGQINRSRDFMRNAGYDHMDLPEVPELSDSVPVDVQEMLGWIAEGSELGASDAPGKKNLWRVAFVSQPQSSETG